jgi:hypothetical protein
MVEAQGLPRHMYLLSEAEAATLDREALEDNSDSVFQVSHCTHQLSMRSLHHDLFSTVTRRSSLPHALTGWSDPGQHSSKPVNVKVCRGSYRTHRNFPSPSQPSYSSSVSILSNLRKRTQAQEWVCRSSPKYSTPNTHADPPAIGAEVVLTKAELGRKPQEDKKRRTK